MTAVEFDFGHLEIDGATARLDLPWITPDCYFEVRPATEANPKFHEAMLALSGKRQRAIVMGSSTMSSKDAKQDRDEDRQLYPKFVIVGWGGIFDKHGKEIPFSIEAGMALLAALPNWIIDKLRVFCMRPENFVTSPAEIPPEPAVLVEN